MSSQDRRTSAGLGFNRGRAIRYRRSARVLILAMSTKMLGIFKQGHPVHQNTQCLIVHTSYGIGYNICTECPS